MKWYVLLGLISAIFCGSAVLATASHHGGPEVIVMHGTPGDVTFNHYAHQAKISVCTECHHKGEDKGKCTSCHGVEENIPSRYHAFHSQCLGCHKNSSGPTKCKGCHSKN